jgi:hypothetical protein
MSVFSCRCVSLAVMSGTVISFVEKLCEQKAEMSDVSSVGVHRN